MCLAMGVVNDVDLCLHAPRAPLPGCQPITAAACDRRARSRLKWGAAFSERPLGGWSQLLRWSRVALLARQMRAERGFCGG